MWASGLLWAARLASLNLCTDEYLLMLGRPSEIASLSYLSRDPEESALWQAARRFPANGGSLESALAARPSLVLTMGGGGRSTALIARRLGIGLLDLPTPHSVAEVGANLDRVARALGDPARSLPLRRRLAALQGSGPRQPEDAVFAGAGGLSVAPDGLQADWMRLAGLRQRSLQGQRLDLETLLTNPPKWLVQSNYRQQAGARGNDWWRHPIVARAPSRRLTADGRLWTCAGPSMIDEVERLRRRG